MITLIVAMNSDRVIGKAGRLPWHHPEDLRHFRRATMGKAVIMGRVTYEELPAPLDGRDVRVMTRRQDYPAATVTMDEVVSLAATQEVMIAGGQQIYELFAPLADRALITIIPGRHDGDAFFPPLDMRLESSTSTNGLTFMEFSR